ncbi:MAG: taurine dioxygenase [Rhodospirillaceae bacterium]|jgi:taurine dioxygenase|nr:taurine dioxygenase [Rhodospirillaceae bacterium]MBT3807893.1 taurine dioxygenase [Rhodospirillaceae bacterium]MBT3932086.1 taurine dioxygenase [Rhodospirillaceae bacterium]MBT4772672.1 taurine dioxygenase [Rhodospirillaceae bacterium]MBT5358150.1 taurine dioxygenase [Rhodospirillaceae bacterium]
MTYESFDLHEMSPACGGVIEGIDLSQNLTNRQFDEIHEALLDRTVIVFRDQDITPEQQVAFARRFGEPQPSSVSGFEKSKENPEIDILEYDADNPPHVTRDLWHTDFVGTERPTMGTVLYAKDIPPQGGDTVWVNMVAAYEALSDRMRAHVDGLWAYHDSYQPYSEFVRPEMYDAEKGTDYLRDKRAAYVPALHPVVRKHPVTGKKGLFVNESMTAFIKDMDRRESDFLLRYLFDYLRTPEFNYRHKWQTNDLAVWDNRLSLHYALFDYTEHRLMHRIVIQGDVPHE